VLDLDDVPEERAAELQREAGLLAGGYDLVQWIGPAPEDALDDLGRLQVLLSTDAPLEDLRWEAEVWDPDRVREQEQDDADKGRTSVATVARHTATGRIVAYTDILVSVHRPELGHQGTTIVEQKHRGHRLGMLAKAANIRQLHASRPQVRRVVTWNAEVNAHMVSINEALGFRKVGRWAEWQLDLSAR
jgi:predicted GNAT family N-acyltransferase